MRSLVILLAAAAIPTASAQTAVPDHRDNILLASYCAEVATNELESTTKWFDGLPSDAKKNPKAVAILQNRRDNLERLTLYLSPDNTKDVSAGDQLSADLRAKEDLAEVFSGAGQCPAYGSPQFKACDDQRLANYPALARIRRCNDLSWLPF